jgi:GTPase SAR1 family protein
MKKKMNIIFIGDGEVGKTCLLNYFDTRKFNKN